MNRPLVSVVVPTYNREHLIVKTIKSVLNQSYTNFELIIVDDASTDNTEKSVLQFDDPRIKFITLKENSKGTKPRNIGIRQSRGKYIALLDSDDEWISTKLEQQLNFIEQFNSTNIFCFTDIILRTDIKEIKSTNKELCANTDIMDYILVEDNSVQTSTYMFSSDLGKKTLFGPDIKKHQDWDFCLRLKKKGAKFVSFPEPLTIYHIDKREDRIAINSKYDLSLDWINQVRTHISEKAYYAFLAKYVSTPLILNKKKLQAMNIYFAAYLKKAINLKVFLKGLVKCSLPLGIIKSKKN